jgi:penicillin G amidase
MKAKIVIGFWLLMLFIPPGLASAQSVSTLTLAGLTSEVTVTRDKRHVPYIKAGNDADLYFTQGYVTAQDRLWQMDLLRRVARGQTAEIFGRITLEEDKRWRRFGFAEIATRTLNDIGPDLRAALENYSRGVNAYIASLDGASLPIEFKVLQYKPREWTPEDTLCIGKIFADALSSTWEDDLLRERLRQTLTKEKFDDVTDTRSPDDVLLFGRDAAKSAVRKNMGGKITLQIAADVEQVISREREIRRASLARTGFYAEGLAASNNFVVSGSRTADGKPLLENDPHLDASAPGIWYLTFLSSPSGRVAGVTFPGVPGIVLGHNENIAWGATNVGPDVQDLYLETFNEAGKYKTPVGWESPIVRKEEIKVRKNPLSPETETVNLDVLETRNGVVISGQKTWQYSLRWTARQPSNNEFEAFYLFNRAKNWGDFKNALKSYGGPTQNFVYADVKGNIGWYAAGKIPTRRTGDGAFPYDGSSNDGEWTGYIPFEKLPNLYNPPAGFIVTANQRTVGDNYPFPQFSRDIAAPWRARRIFDSIKAKPRLTMDDARDIELDVFNIPLSAMAREIVQSKAASASTLATLRSWDGKMTQDSKGALVANGIRNCVAGKMAADNPGLPVYVLLERVVDSAVASKTSRWLPKNYASYDSLLTACDKEVQTDFAQRFGADESGWVWGAVSTSNFPHPLAIAPLIGGKFATPKVPLAGSGQTPNVGSSVSMRHISSAGNWDATRFVIPLGESGDPSSPFYKDQFDAWRTGAPLPLPFSDEAIQKAAIETLKMAPK